MSTSSSLSNARAFSMTHFGTAQKVSSDVSVRKAFVNPTSLPTKETSGRLSSSKRRESRSLQDNQMAFKIAKGRNVETLFGWICHKQSQIEVWGEDEVILEGVEERFR